MHVAFFVGDFPELSETFILDQISGLLARGHEVTICARAPSAAAAQPHRAVVEHRLLERTRYWNAKPVVRLARLLHAALRAASNPMRFSTTLGRWAGAVLQGTNADALWKQALVACEIPKPDVVVAHFGPNAVMAQALRDLGVLNAPLVAVFHGYDLTRVLCDRRPEYYSRLLERADLVVTVSRRFCERLEMLGCARDKLRLHRMGVDLSQLAPRERTLAPGAAPLFVSVCRLVEKKGLEVGLQAFAAARHDMPGATWEIIGDGPLRARLERRRDELGLGNDVVFHGARPHCEVRALLERAHVLVAPSVTAEDGDQEGVPVAIMEAMAMGLPVVASRHSGIPELVRAGETGLLAPERDVEELARALVDVVRNAARWPAMGRNARHIIETEHDVHVLNARLEQMLLELARVPAPDGVPALHEPSHGAYN